MSRVEFIYIKQETEEIITIGPNNTGFKIVDEEPTCLSPEIEIYNRPKHKTENKKPNKDKGPKTKRIFSIAIISMHFSVKKQ